MYHKLFDLDRDGQLDAGEMALEYMTFCAVTGDDEQDGEDYDPACDDAGDV